MSLAIVDKNPPTSGFQGFFLTVSPKDQFTADQVQVLKSFHSKFDQHLLISEVRGNGVDHYHSVYSSRAKKTNGETVRLERLFDKHGIEYHKLVTIVIKKITHVVGLFHYLLKDQPVDTKPLSLHGWRMTWIKQQVLDNVKNMPKKMLEKGVFMLTKRNSVSMVLAYAKAAGMPIAGREGFIEVFCDMQEKNYNFSSVRLRDVYIGVMSVLGDRGPSRYYAENELFGYP